MKTVRNDSLRGASPSRQRGAVAVLVAVSVTMLFGFVSLVVDTGRIIQIRRSLQASTDSAALAAGSALVNGASAADAMAKLYGAGAGAYNAVSGVSTSTTTTTPKCLSTLVNLGVPCFGSPAYNAMSVTQSVTVPLTFGMIFNKASWTLTSSSMASLGGGFNVKPLNVILVLDTTASMNNNDPACGKTRLNCALDGVQTLLKLLKPSASNVGLMVYPPVASAADAAKNYDCVAGTAPTIAKYGDPAAQYSIIGSGAGLVNDFMSSNTSTSLSTTSNLSRAVGAAGTNCQLSAKGGAGTYFADAIRNAQSSLNTLPNKTTAQSVIVLLSDGDAGTAITNLVQAWTNGATYKPGDQVSVSSTTYYSYIGASSSVSSAATMPGSGANWAAYWTKLSGASATKASNQCAAAVSAAAAAKAAGTRVYSIGYSPSTSGSCATDTPAISACQTMRAIASDASTFYSTTTNSSCQPGTGMSLNQIFYSLAQTFNNSRLLPLDAQ